jgi:hypothetical protein
MYCNVKLFCCSLLAELQQRREAEIARVEEETVLRAEQQKLKVRTGFGKHPLDKEIIFTPEEFRYIEFIWKVL